jgi:penicillin-binding protein 1A
MGAGMVAGIATALLIADIYRRLPSVSELEVYRPSLVTRVWSRDGEVVGEFFRERRVVLSFEEIPPLFVRAILSAEDHDFYRHPGADLLGIARAAVKNLLAGRVRQGGSTITQQMAKTLYLTPERTFLRKIKELFLSLAIERRYSKDEILALYINQIYFGHGAYGAEAASQRFFGHPLARGDLAEWALLAGLPKAPAIYSPLRHPERALARRNHVLDLMERYGEISAEEAERARAAPLELAPGGDRVQRAGYFVEQVRRKLIDRFGVDAVFSGGLDVRTTLDWRLQQAAETACAQGLAEYERRRWGEAPPAGEPRPQVALLALDPRTGDVLALVGGRDFAESPFDRAFQAQRPVGSTFKPILYLTALEHGFTPASVLVDAPVSYRNPYNRRTWSPANYGGRHVGPVTLHRALAQSINVVAVKLLDRLGADSVIRTARRLGIESNLNPYLSLALGACDLRLSEMVRAYCAFAAGGILPELRLITAVRRPDGRRQEFPRGPRRSVIEPDVARVLVDMLQGVVEYGTARRARRLPFPTAGKTGTTDDYSDAWFIGFTPNLIAGVWVGFDRPRSLGRGESGGRLALPIWIAFMQEALAEQPPAPFPNPPGIVHAEICQRTGLLATPTCPERQLMAFRQGRAPRERCSPELHEQTDRD